MSDPIDYLIVPGWHGSGPDHWQSHWQALMPNSRRSQVGDWEYPDREDWIDSLQREVTASTSRRQVIVAHSLGCVTVAHWAQRYGQQYSDRILGALLVAPADVERPDAAEALRGFAPIPLEPLPFPSLLIGSTNDRAASADRALALAAHWGSDVEILENVGHINSASGHHQWIGGLRYLARLVQRPYSPRLAPSAARRRA